MFNFCTLFDSNYLSRGLALLQSLKETTPAFHLYIVAFDNACYQYLSRLEEKDLTVISLAEFEDEKLKEVKAGRSAAEYCWTCTPSVILYCIERYHLPSCTYVDADMIFYHDPKILFDESGDKSIIISEHRYTPDYDVAATHGIYCVQFMYFKNDQNGLNALTWWRDRCIEWCFAYLEDGKFGDQKYLDKWPEIFQGVHVMQHPGGGLAPWNVQQFEVSIEAGKIILVNKDGQAFPLIFYHFHGLKFYSDEKISCCDALYELDEEVKEVLYFPYIRKLVDMGSRIKESGFKGDPQGAKQPSPASGKTLTGYIKNVIFLTYKGKLPLFKKRLFTVRLHSHIYKLNRIIPHYGLSH